MRAFLAGLLCCALLGAASPEVLRQILAAEHGRALDGLPGDLDGDPAVAARAALAIGRTKDRSGAPALRAHLSAIDPAERTLVVYALGLLADAESLSRIQTMLADRNSAVRYAAADAVGRIAAAASPPPTAPADSLLNAARSDADPIVRGHAAANLDVFRTTSAAQRLAFGLQAAFRRERSTDVRWHIMWTLSRGYAAQTSQAFFVSALHDPSDLVRLGAVRGLGRQKDVNAARFVRPMLDDPSWRVQEEATESLRRLTGKSPTEHLAALQSGLHLPPAVQAESVPAPRPSAPKPAAPTLSDVILKPPLDPTSAALMNGPMPGPHPRVRVLTTAGTFVLRLYPEWAPFTVANFLNLTGAGFFDRNRWFRVVPDFVVQTGDPTNTGDGDAGFTIGAEENPVEQRAGIISMGLDYDDKTNTPKRDSAGSQFYITLSPQLHLDRDFTVFGEVETGFDVLSHIVESDKMLRVERIEDD